MSSGAVALGDLDLPMLEVACDRCSRHGERMS
jgi:hypothetical protein